MFTGSPSQEYPLRLNLQRFAEGDPPVDPPAADPVPPSDPTPPPDPGTPPTDPPQLPPLKVKFNHEEREIPYDEAVQLAQKGMNYEKAVERAKQEARDAYIAEQGLEWQGKPIKTEAEYKQALREQEIYNSLKTKELPPEVIEEIVESRRFREEVQSERQTKAQQEKQQADYAAFISAYPDVKPEEIPAEVWAEVDKGKPLVDAYAKRENTLLKAKIAEFETKLKAQETNGKNAASSPGSVTGNGNAKDDFVSLETFEANKNDQSWVMKNYPKIMASRNQW